MKTSRKGHTVPSDAYRGPPLTPIIARCQNHMAELNPKQPFQAADQAVVSDTHTLFPRVRGCKCFVFFSCFPAMLFFIRELLLAPLQAAYTGCLSLLRPLPYTPPLPQKSQKKYFLLFKKQNTPLLLKYLSCLS